MYLERQSGGFSRFCALGILAIIVCLSWHDKNNNEKQIYAPGYIKYP